MRMRHMHSLQRCSRGRCTYLAIAINVDILPNPRCPAAPTELLPSAAAVVLARLPPRRHLRAGPPARADLHSVQRKLSDEAALPNARVPCLLQCAALCATARLSQKC
jgi:hypothetical protein